MVSRSNIVFANEKLMLVIILSGDKSNHALSIHVPQLYYFVGFTTLFGWPVLISGPLGIVGLAKGVSRCMFGTKM